jgi:hypothetical protein
MSADRSSFAAWREILDQIDQALAQSLALAVEPAGAPEMTPKSRPGGSVDQRLAALQACLDRAEQEVAVVDAGVQADIDALQRWSEQVRHVRQLPMPA